MLIAVFSLSVSRCANE